MARTLQLVNLEKYSRTGLNLPTGVTVIIQRNEVIKVEDDIAEVLLDADKCNFDEDDNALPWFAEVGEDAKVDHDFTLPPVEVVAYGTPVGETVHDEAALDAVTKADIALSGEKAAGIKRATQRGRAK